MIKDSFEMLILEDSDEDKTILERGIKKSKLPINITWATKVKDAELIWNDKKFDIAVIDQNLPDGKGLELIHIMKNWSDDKTPIIFMTNLESTILKSNATQNKDVYFLAKSEPLDQFIDLLKRLILVDLAN